MAETGKIMSENRSWELDNYKLLQIFSYDV